jgi:histidine triad (HIT) family protein
MTSNEQQISELKQQIIKQISSSFPEDKKEYAIQKIKEMDESEFIEFLKNNNLIEKENPGSEENYGGQGKTTPFRLIVNKKIPSYIIEENKVAIAVLEINPISNGHIIIIPKKPISNPEKIPKQINNFANKISKRITLKFKPKKVIITPASILGEIIINLVPIYSNESLDSPRKKASEQELNEIKNIFQEKTAIKKQAKTTEKKIEEKKIILPKRIP